MANFSVRFIRSRPGIDRSQPDWDDGLLNFGYEEYEGVAPFELMAKSFDEARAEAAVLVQEIVIPTAPLAGYWLMQGDDIVETIFIDEPE